jgi:hypothetical protein
MQPIILGVVALCAIFQIDTNRVLLQGPWKTHCWIDTVTLKANTLWKETDSTLDIRWQYTFAFYETPFANETKPSYATFQNHTDSSKLFLQAFVKTKATNCWEKANALFANDLYIVFYSPGKWRFISSEAIKKRTCSKYECVFIQKGDTVDIP